MMLHTEYQGSSPYGFRQEDFFRSQGHNVNKLGIGLQDYAIYQISWL